MSGSRKAGRDVGSSPMSLTVRRLPRSSVTAAAVSSTIATRGEGITVVTRGRTKMIARAIPTIG